MKKYKCYKCGAFLCVYEIKESDLKPNQDREFIGSVELVCNNKKCVDYGKHHVDNFRDEKTW
jgi:hypothetical protein